MAFLNCTVCERSERAPAQHLVVGVGRLPKDGRSVRKGEGRGGQLDEHRRVHRPCRSRDAARAPGRRRECGRRGRPALSALSRHWGAAAWVHGTRARRWATATMAEVQPYIEVIHQCFQSNGQLVVRFRRPARLIKAHSCIN